MEPIWAALAVLLFFAFVIGIISWFNRPTPEQREVRRVYDRVRARRDEIGPTPRCAADEVDYWILAAMSEQLFQGLDGPDDISRSTAIMASLIPQVMIGKAARKARMDQEAVRLRWEALRAEMTAPEGQ